MEWGLYAHHSLNKTTCCLLRCQALDVKIIEVERRDGKNFFQKEEFSAAYSHWSLLAFGHAS